MTNASKSAVVYPLTVVAYRYGGVYSGGRFTAWNLDPCDVPEAPWGDDGEASEFWWAGGVDGFIVGVGSTPKEAIDDLFAQGGEPSMNRERWVVRGAALIGLFYGSVGTYVVLSLVRGHWA